jgi:membrane protein DedA with SNARE-associated domain
VTADEPPAEAPETPGDPQPWYEQPGLPFNHKPTRAELVCYSGILAVTVYSFAIMFLRPRLITWSPPLAAAISGGRSSVVATGAFARVEGYEPWFTVLIWAVASVSLVKWCWVYWWAGHLWGEGIIDIWAGQTERSKRRAARAVRVTQRFWWLAVILTFLPLPFPMPIVFAAIGAAGITFRRFLIPVLATSFVLQALYLGLGWWIGEPVVQVVDLIARYLLWITLAIVAGTIALAVWREHRKVRAAPAQPPG